MRKFLSFLCILLPCFSFSQSVNIGDILCTDGSTVSPASFPTSGKTAQGIVFYVDGTDSHGWAVALNNQSPSIKWCSEGQYGFDIPDLPNIANARAAMHDLDGNGNTGIIRRQGNSSQYPAAWAVDYDNGWYLPSGGQLRYLYSYAPEINASLQIVGGTSIPIDGNYYWWSSTEFTECHAYDMNTGGSLGDYVKDNHVNYPPNGIAVRQIRDFTITNPAHPTYHIGDLITNDDGSQGILFYITPDQTEGWMVALNDASSSVPWGNGDVSGLDNQTCSAPYGLLLNETDGFANTGAIRAQQTGQNTAANVVDYEHGWYLPTAGQLSKLFGALGFIEDELQSHGSTLANAEYWSSTEVDGSNAFTLSCNPSANVRAGHFARRDKTSNYRVREVRNLTFEIPPLPEPSIPDNILESNCNRPLDGNTWSIQLLASHQVNDIASYAPIMAGDIDGNGMTDIVIAHYNGNNYRTNTLDVYSGIDLSLQYRFNIQDSIYVSNGPYAIMRYPKDDGSIQGAIFVHGYDKKIRSYAIDGTLLNVSDHATSCDGMVSFADFNGDGYPEVYSGSDIFDAATLKWLCSGPEDGNHGLSFRGAAVGVVNHHRCYFTMSLASNVLGDARQELICGNTIYNVNIVSRTNSSLNSVTVTKTVTPPSGYSPDGHVSLADFDLDGECEVLVTKCDTDDHTSSLSYFYAYKPSNGQILFQKSIQCLTTGYPLIGNIDNDPHPEIVFLEKQDYDPKIYCLRYTSQNGLATLWLYPHNDTSGQTGITLFDFNQDNIMEIVYRDSENLRIINGNSATPHNLFTRRMAAGTGCEYPIIADINGDGSAEIVATGLLDQSANLPGNGGLYVFGSPGNWSPARPVWNQYMYHVTNINEDLTVPTYCFNTATIFTAPDGTIRRPYNNFLQQAYYITPEGEPYNPGGIIEVDVDGVTCSTFTFNGITYDEEGLYEQTIESEEGCDTLYRIMVTITDAYQMETTVTVCGEAYAWNGTTYTETGDYQQEFTSTDGCDSIVTLHLNVFDAYDIALDTAVCGSLVWAGHEYTQSGHYEQAFVTANGCDSVFRMDLTVWPYPEAIPAITGPQEIYVATDLVVGQYFYFIDSVPSATYYEWTLVGADWVMDTTGTICSLLVTTPGTATLKVKAWNDCGYTEQEIIIHAGFHDVNDNQAIPVNVYPNPAHDKVFIEAESIMRVRLFDLLGQCLVEKEGNGDKMEINLKDLASSVYIIEILTKQGQAIRKLDVTR